MPRPSHGAEADELEHELDQLVTAAAPATMSRLGCGTHQTAALLVAAGENIGRLSSEASFAHLCGVAPLAASSASSPERSTAPFEPTSPPSKPALDSYRNVPG